MFHFDSDEDVFCVYSQYYDRLEVGDGKLTTYTGVDLHQAESVDLLELSLIDGSRGYREYPSLRKTLQNFEDSGMTVETVPQYK